MISTVTTTTTTVVTSEVMTYSIIAVGSLILLLALKEILSSEPGHRNIRTFLKGSNVAIIPLLLIFTAVVAYKFVTLHLGSV